MTKPDDDTIIHNHYREMLEWLSKGIVVDTKECYITVSFSDAVRSDRRNLDAMLEAINQTMKEHP